MEFDLPVRPRQPTADPGNAGSDAKGLRGRRRRVHERRCPGREAAENEVQMTDYPHTFMSGKDRFVRAGCAVFKIGPLKQPIRHDSNWESAAKAIEHAQQLGPEYGAFFIYRTRSGKETTRGPITEQDL